jgi:deoxyribodipyrimidine photolyase
MDTDEMKTKLKNFISKSSDVTKSAFSKASNAVQKFSDKSVLKIEIKQMESKKEKLFTKIGKHLSSILANENVDLMNLQNSNDEKITTLIEEIKTFQAEIVQLNLDIEKNKEELKKAQEKDSTEEETTE